MFLFHLPVTLSVSNRNSIDMILELTPFTFFMKHVESLHYAHDMVFEHYS